MRARDPWTIVFPRRDIPQRIFKLFLEVVRAAVSSFGVSCTETRVTDEISYVYKTEQTLPDCVTLQKNQSGSIFPKKSKCLGGNAKVIVSVDKPFVISYLKKKQQVMLRCHLQLHY